MATSKASVMDDPDRVVIEQVSPQIDCGRHPAKRVLGDRVWIGAVIYKDGHDLLAGRLLYKGPRQRKWRYEPLQYDYTSDRWYGSFLVDQMGSWYFSVEAWPDEFGTWRSGLEKKFEAGMDIGLELREGAALLRDAAERAKGEAKDELLEAAKRLASTRVQAATRVKQALDPKLEALAQDHFDPEKVTRYERSLPLRVDRERARYGAWYEFFPRSQGPMPGVHGTFKTAEEQLERVAELGFDVVYLPPIHPIGTTKRKGRNNRLVAGENDPGSPWAIGGEAGGHKSVHPELGTIEDFDRFVERAEELGLEVALDYALQCSPDHPWVKEHPDWFTIRPDGSIQYAENPPKTYEDIYPLDFWCEDRKALWQACLDILEHWIDHGVKIFRVDNPHTKPLSFWEWIIEEIHREHPEVIFLAEAFTRPNKMKGLAKLGFTQSYTYFTWRNSAEELREYMKELTRTEMVDYFRPNFFANTPDILTEYLQEGGCAAFRVRLLLAATLSPTYGIYSGFELCENTPRSEGSEEYLNSEKYELKHRDFDAPGNLNDDIRRINRIRHENPALQQHVNLAFHQAENDQVIFYRKWSGDNDLLMVVNTDPEKVQESTVQVPLSDLGLASEESYELEDLMTGERHRWHGSANYVRLDPEKQAGHILRLVRSGESGL